MTVPARRWVGAAIAACAALPVLLAPGVPVMHHDWAWPVAAPYARDWLSAWVGQWSDRGLGEPNLLPLMTYEIPIEAIATVLLGSVWALALFLAASIAAAYAGAHLLAERLGVRHWYAQAAAASLFAFHPVFYTRVQAGHTAYLVAYACTPWIVSLAGAIGKPRRTWIVLASLYALAASQVQWLVFGAVSAMEGLLLGGVTLAKLRVAGRAIALGIMLQAQGLIPLIVSGSAAIYYSTPALPAWERNLSSPFPDVVAGLGYFTHYYERAALPGADALVIGVTAAALVVALLRSPRAGVWCVGVWASGVIVSWGIDGPMAPLLTAFFATFEVAAVFRDLHYAAVFTAVGSAGALGLAIDGFALPAFAAACAVIWIAVPSLRGFDLGPLSAPRSLVADTVATSTLIAAHGPGRVLWLPPEAPVSIPGRAQGGLEYATYGLPGNPSANHSREFQALAFAQDALRMGRPLASAFSRLGIRYVVTRDEQVVSQRDERFGTDYPLTFPGIPDRDLERVLYRSPGFRELGRAGDFVTFEVDRPVREIGERTVVSDALLFSELLPGEHAVLSPGRQVLQPKLVSNDIDVRHSWVDQYIAVRARVALADSIYPFVLTDSHVPLRKLTQAGSACAEIYAESPFSIDGQAFRGERRWVPVTVGPESVLRPTGFTAVSGISGISCERRNRVRTRTFVWLAHVDRSWIDVRTLSRPKIIDGWAMGWDDPEPRLVYIPALAQAFALIAAAAVLAWSCRPSRRRA